MTTVITINQPKGFVGVNKAIKGLQFRIKEMGPKLLRRFGETMEDEIRRAAKNTSPKIKNFTGKLLGDGIEWRQKPKGNQEIITVFAYYLNKHCQIPNMGMGHAVSCYNEVGERKPKNIYSICLNARSRKAFLDTGDENYTFKITIQGENLIEQDLPSKTKPKK